jgi:hypothetical protein
MCESSAALADATIDEAVGHHVLGHLHLLAVDRLLGVVGEERHERPEGQRVEDDPDVRVGAGGARLVEPRPEPGESCGALLVVGGVHVDEQRLAAGLGDLALDVLDVLEPGPEVEVDARDPVPGPG